MKSLSSSPTSTSMESKSHLSASSNRTSDMQTDVSSAIEPKSNFQIDGSSTPMESKGQAPTSIDRMSATETDGYLVIERNSTTQTDGESPMKTNEKSHAPSTIALKHTGKIVASSAMQMKTGGKPVGSSVIATKPHGKSAVVSGNDVDVMGFGSTTQTDGESPMKTNEKSHAPSTIALKHTGKIVASSAMQMKTGGKAVGSSVIETKPHGKAAVVSGNDVEVMGFYEVTLGPHEAELRFRLIHLWEAQNPHTKTLIGEEMLLIDEQNSPVPFPEDRFQFHDHEEFEANCDLMGDLYDYVGHMRLINGRAMTEHLIIDEVDIAEKRHLVVHLWDQAATAFCQKFKSYESTPRVLLVTTVNPKRIGGVANEVIADVVTKPETVTLGELFSYIKQKTAKVAWFECTVTIDDVLHGSPWYYISCGGCNTKATKGPTSLVCTNKKCAKSEVVGVPQYLTKISVYDKSEQAVFVLLGDAGRELTGKHVSELVARYFETHKFVVKVSQHNLTVTKVLPAPAPQNAIEDPADERIRKASGCLESHEAKRAKSG
uniref:Replication factor A C-terminal domain-containing protein n=1 Tax=Brassica oleracea var. oleracea TaxID=109376 RepID=A0A0D3EFE0_BRAOL